MSQKWQRTLVLAWSVTHFLLKDHTIFRSECSNCTCTCTCVLVKSWKQQLGLSSENSWTKGEGCWVWETLFYPRRSRININSTFGFYFILSYFFPSLLVCVKAIYIAAVCVKWASSKITATTLPFKRDFLFFFTICFPRPLWIRGRITPCRLKAPWNELSMFKKGDLSTWALISASLCAAAAERMAACR